MDQKDQESILKRIGKLLALSKSSNPNEAAAALSRAQKLMAQYGLSEKEISLSSIGEQKTETISGVRRSAWCFGLGRIISKGFGIDYFATVKSGTSSSITFIGPKERLEPAIHACIFLQRQLKNVITIYRAQAKAEVLKDYKEWICKGTNGYIFGRELERFKKDLDKINSYAAFDDYYPWYFNPKLSYSARKDAEAKVRNYIDGWLYSVEEKVQEFTADNQDEVKKLIDEYIDKNHDLHTYESRGSSLSDDEYAAYCQGKEDGRNGFSLLHGVSGSGSGRLSYNK